MPVALAQCLAVHLSQFGVVGRWLTEYDSYLRQAWPVEWQCLGLSPWRLKECQSLR